MPLPTYPPASPSRDSHLGFEKNAVRSWRRSESPGQLYLFMRDEHNQGARRTKASWSRERWSTSSCNRPQHFNGKQRCKRTGSGSKRPGSYVAAATIIVAAAPPPAQQSGLHASGSRRPATSQPFLLPIHPGSRGPYCVPGPGVDTRHLTNSP